MGCKVRFSPRGGRTVKRLIAIAIAFLTLTAVSAVTATGSSASVCLTNGTGCTQAGSYPNLNAVINSDYNGVLSVVWTSSVVQPYSSGGEPLYWTAYATYTNISTSTVSLDCTGSGSGGAGSTSEDMSGGSGDDGTVPASSSQCTENPGATFTVPPGGTATDWATFNNVPWPGSTVSITWGDIGTSPSVNPFGAANADWAGPTFCSGDWPNAPGGVPALGTPYNGVSACGYSVQVGNYEGPISYNNVIFDGTGFQCVELAARYFYFETTQDPPHPQLASDFAYDLSLAPYNYQVYPGGSLGETSTFNSSLTAGNIISMWSADDSTGHVGVVTGFDYTQNGTLSGINVMDENGGGTGSDTITVYPNGTMYYAVTATSGYNEFQWTTNLPGS
jgi:hypothetical protein